MLATSAFMMRRTSSTMVCSAGANSGRELVEVSNGTVMKSSMEATRDQKLILFNRIFYAEIGPWSSSYTPSSAKACAARARPGKWSPDYCSHCALNAGEGARAPGIWRHYHSGEFLGKAAQIDRHLPFGLPVIAFLSL